MSPTQPAEKRSQVDQTAKTARWRPFEVTNRLVLAIAVPMMLAYVSTPLMGLVATAVVGQLGDPALLGGLAAGAMVFDVVFSSFNFLRSGTTGMVAQAFGRNDGVAEQAVFWRAVATAVVLGAILILASPLIATAGAAFVSGGPGVTAAMKTYVLIRLISSPFALSNYAILGYVLGRGEARLGLALQLVLNLTNIVLSITFGLWLGWGIVGVAWAAVIGEALAAAIGLTILVTRFRRLPPLPRGMLRDRHALTAMFAVNRDIMIRTFALLGAFALFTRQGAQLGTVMLAANAVLMNFFMLSAYFLDGFATAAEQLAGRAVGARFAPAFYKAVRLTAVWGFAISGIAAGFFLLFGDQLVALITTSQAVRETAAIYLPWGALTAVSGVMAFQMDGVFIGATWSREMRNMMLLSFVVYFAALIVLGHYFGNGGLWAALHVFLIVRGLSLLAVLPARARRAF